MNCVIVKMLHIVLRTLQPNQVLFFIVSLSFLIACFITSLLESFFISYPPSLFFAVILLLCLHYRCFILCLNSKLSLNNLFLCLHLIRLVSTFLVYSALLLYFISFCSTDTSSYFVYIRFTSFDIVKSITTLLALINACFLGLLYFYFILHY